MDNLPVAQVTSDAEADKIYTLGFPLGAFTLNNEVSLNPEINIEL